MSQAFLDGRVVLHAGDCLDVLATLAENSLDACACDPPYHLTSIIKRFGSVSAAPAKVGATGAFSRASRGFMGKKWDGGDVAFKPETWAAVMRVLKPGAYLIAFSGTRTYHRMVCAIEDAGFDVRDQLAWVFGSGFPKSKNLGDGWGTALKPAWEPICLARKPFTGTNLANMAEHGVGGLNIGVCRVDVTGQRPYEIKAWEPDQHLCDSCAALAEKTPKPATPATRASTAQKPAAPISSERAAASRPDTDKPDIGCSDGTTPDGTSTSSSTSKSGKTLTDLSPQDLRSTTETKTRATTTSEICSSCHGPITAHTTSGNTPPTKSGLQQHERQPAHTGPGGETAPLGRWPANLIHDGSEEVLAAFPGVKPATSRTPSDAQGVTSFGAGNNLNIYQDDTDSAARFFYTSKADADDRLGSKHPTVKPLDLMQYLVRLVTPKGGVVLDPFAGTGTTGEAAFREGMRAILIEREPEYQADIARRMELAEHPSKRAAVAKTKNNLQGAEGTPLFGAVA